MPYRQLSNNFSIIQVYLSKINTMRFTSYISITALLVIGFSINSCDTKVDLVEEGRETAVIYGFLDPNIDTQFVKITKSFITEGSAIDAALYPENSQYDNLEAYVTAYDDGDTVDSYLLYEKIVNDKDSGAFYYPTQMVYYFTEPLNSDYTYDINFFGSDNDVSSSTSVVGDFKNDATTNSPTINLVFQFDVGGSIYNNKPIRLTSAKNAKRYEFTFVFNYIEVYTDGTQKEKVINFGYPDWETSSLNGGEINNYLIDGETFFQSIAGRIISEDNEENVEKRIIGTMNYVFEYAGSDLNTFIELNQPSTSINVEQNPYSNISNGIGVWSTRGLADFDDIIFELQFSNSYKELAIGQYTGGLKFCSTQQGHDGTLWGCN